MTKPPCANFFTQDFSEAYDERNARLATIADNMHFLIGLVLQDLPLRARVLCAGVGTGAEILSLAKIFPEWTFVGVDPSESMLAVCARRLDAAGVSGRCQLVQGYVDDLPAGEEFDAALSILVAHFVGRKDRVAFFRSMTERLKPQGYLINAEIGFDIDAAEFPAMLEQWKKIQTLMGATPESLSKLPAQFRDVLTVMPGPEIEAALRQSRIANPVRFFQSFMISAWYGQKMPG